MNILFEKIKKSYKSMTIWLNGILLAALPVIEYARDNLQEVQQFLPDNIYRSMGLAVVVVNIVLRFRTDKGLHEK